MKETDKMHSNANDKSEHIWGYHINRAKYPQSSPSIPEWARSHKSDWVDRGLVIWDEATKSVTHLRASYILDLQIQMAENDVWKNDGIIVGDRAYEIIIESNERQKTKKSDDTQENKPNGRLALINQIKLSPSQAQELFAFLQSHRNQIQKMADEDDKEIKRILGQVYSLILSW
ncbi:MAG TPA: hypothetical protein VIJ93_11505, partial [bacterium]